MKNFLVKTVLLCLFCKTLTVCAFCESEANLLANRGFLKSKVGETLPDKTWKIRYNKVAKGMFINDETFKGEGPILEINNPSKNDAFTLISTGFIITRPGNYRMTIWVKASNDVRKLTKKKFGILLRLIRTDWKKGYYGEIQTIHKKWLKYEFEIYIPALESNKRYWARFDVTGSGTFYFAKPSIEMISETKNSAKAVSSLQETAYFSFDKSLDESNSRAKPSVSDKATLIPGFKGQAVTVQDGGVLCYPVNNFLKGDSGSIAYWLKTSTDPVPTFVPTDPVGFDITGQNILGKSKTLFKMRTTAPGSFLSFHNAYGKIGVGFRPRKTLYGKEWRHLIYTWDKNSGLKVYLDGRPFLESTSSKKQNKRLSQKLKLEQISLLTAIGNNSEEKAYFDELRFFNRALSKSEALELYENDIPSYPVLMDYTVIAGSNQPYRVRMLHKKDSPGTIINVQAEEIGGKKLFETTLNVDSTGDYAIPFCPPAPGDYRLVFLYNNKRIRTFEVAAISPESITDNMPVSDSGDIKTKLIDELDCGEEHGSNRYLDDGKVRVVNSPIGKYRESTRKNYMFNRPGGFAYRFTINSPKKPHWLEIEYPDDKPRMFYVVVEQKVDNHGWGKTTYTNSYSLDTIGVANGINNPVTGKMAKKRLLFWPDSTQIFVGCFGYKTYPGTAGPAMKNIRIFENYGPLPRIKVNVPETLAKRTIGTWNEDPGMPHKCWFKKYITNQGPTFDLWRDRMQRRVEYIRFTGQNLATIQVFPYDGDNNGMHGIFPMMGSGENMPGWACLVAATFNREMIPFYIQFNDRWLGIPLMVGLDKLSVNAVEAAAKGLNSIEMMSADAKLPATSSSRPKHNTLNFLCPIVKEAHLKRIRFFRDQFAIYDAFKGISYYYSQILSFRDEKTGYGDYTISLFEKETGIKLPVDAKGMERFNKRFTWLKSNANTWDKWLDWRCAKVKEFLQELCEELNSGKRKDLKIIYPIHTNTNHFILDSLDNYPAAIDIKSNLRTMGIDISSLSRLSSLIIEPISAPNYGLINKKIQAKNLDAFWYSENFAELINSCSLPAFLLSRHANMEIHSSRSSEIKKFWWPFGSWGNNGGIRCFSTALPDNKYLPQTLAWTLANCDIRCVNHGWWGSPENGAHEQFQQFYRAYRSIPAETFKKVPGVNDPVMVRIFNNSKSNFNPLNWFCGSSGPEGWFYMVNMQYYKSKIKISFDSEVHLTNAVLNCPQKTSGNVLEIELDPYQVLCFSSKDALTITKVEQLVPKAIVKKLEQTVANLKTGIQVSPSPQAAFLVKTAEEMLSQKRYSALYYLSRSSLALQLTKEAANPVVFQFELNPNTNCVTVKAKNRMSIPVSAEVTLKNLPHPLTCQNKEQKLSLGAKESKQLTFQLNNLVLRNVSCRNKLEFCFEYRINKGEIKILKYACQPILSRKATNIKIDGNLNDWNNAVWNQLGKCDFSMNFRDGLKYGQPPFKAIFAVKWSEDGLFIAVRVNEKDLIPSPANKKNWHYDFIEIMFDQCNDAGTETCGIDEDDFTLFIKNLENVPQPQAQLYQPNVQIKALESLCKTARTRNGNLTSYEIFIPSKILSRVNLKPGANLGFALKLHNREHKNSRLDLWDFAVSTEEYPCGKPNLWNDILFLDKQPKPVEAR